MESIYFPDESADRKHADRWYRALPTKLGRSGSPPEINNDVLFVLTRIVCIKQPQKYWISDEKKN